MEEIWKNIEGFPDYQVSNLGRVKSFKIEKEGKILKLQSDKDGYFKAMLYDPESKQFLKSVHRLVVLSFIPNPNNYPQVNHINGIKNDNRLENLEWCNGSYDALHAYRIGLRTRRKGKLNLEIAKQIRQQFATKQFTQTEIAKQYNVDRRAIYQIVRNLVYNY